MLKLTKKESLNLYLYLSDKNNLNDELNNVLMSLENEIFKVFSVSEIEEIKLEFKAKGKV